MGEPCLQRHSREWTSTTSGLVGALAVLTLLALVTGVQLRIATREAQRRGEPPSQPDWLADALALGELGAAKLGPRQRTHAVATLRWLDNKLVARVRSHPLRFAGAFSIAVGTAAESPQVILEGYSPAFAAYVVGISACSLFAFVVIVGAHLRVVQRRSEPTSPAVHALVAACVGATLGVSFRGSLWWVIGTDDRNAGLSQLTVLTLILATVGGVLILAGELLLRQRPV